MNKNESKKIDKAIETIRSVAYPSRELIENFPAYADQRIERILSQIVSRVNKIQYDYDRNEKYTKCQAIPGS